MNQFAKLFESNGFQVLVKKSTLDTNDGTVPKVSIITRFSDDVEMDFGIELEADIDRCWDERDRIFDSINQNSIDSIFDTLSPDMTADEAVEHIW
ncbi:hypothetical protein CTT31_20765 [Pseudoalteromonas maricaloris]|uniref:hypothetical protein n=1 Tax=Pseudoalteromonas maricaloris TaxID=184924 RepID=UPI0021AD9968|nr:hypothetical protein [Pseudoalteromonas flavipulchra]USE71518.1 hypothetical protein CTT31_20765 [Pseudoalteromonas flavipulchra]